LGLAFSNIIYIVHEVGDKGSLQKILFELSSDFFFRGVYIIIALGYE